MSYPSRMGHWFFVGSVFGKAARGLDKTVVHYTPGITSGFRRVWKIAVITMSFVSEIKYSKIKGKSSISAP